MRKIIIAAIASGAALIVPASASAQPAAVTTETVVIGPCTAIGTPASCSPTAAGNPDPIQPYAYKVHEFIVHVRSNLPSGQKISTSSLYLKCTGPRSPTPPEPQAQQQTGYQDPGPTPFDPVFIPPYHRFCQAGASASVPTGSTSTSAR
jgi:hypothetical protein